MKKAQWLHQHRFPRPRVHPRLQDPLSVEVKIGRHGLEDVVTHQTELTWYSSSCNILEFNICVLHQNILSDHPRMRMQTPTGAGKKSTFRLKYNSLLNPEKNNVKISWQTNLVSCSWYNLMTQSVVPSVRMDFTEVCVSNHLPDKRHSHFIRIAIFLVCRNSFLRPNQRTEHPPVTSKHCHWLNVTQCTPPHSNIPSSNNQQHACHFHIRLFWTSLFWKIENSSSYN